MNLTKISQPLSYKQQAYETLKNSIVTHKILPGTTIYERDLSERLGISRTPLREALQHLEIEGWLKSVPRKGVFVSTISKRDAEEVLQLRQANEMLIMDLLIPTITNDMILAIENAFILQKEEKENAEKFISIDKDFHLLLAEFAGNQRLLQLMHTLSDQMRWLGMRALKSENRIEETLKEHAIIIDSLKDRDIEKAKNSIFEHVEMTKKAILFSLEKET